MYKVSHEYSSTGGPNSAEFGAAVDIMPSIKAEEVVGSLSSAIATSSKVKGEGKAVFGIIDQRLDPASLRAETRRSACGLPAFFFIIKDG